MPFANQVSIVTGASSGIGWELAKELARQHCAVGLIARRQEKLEQLVQEIQAAGGKAAFAVADVGRRAEIVPAIHSLRDQLGPVDLLIANSGVGFSTKLDPLNIEEMEQMFQVNTLGVVYSLEGVLPEMLKRGKGHVAAVSSLAAYLPMPGESGYCASKAAVNVYMDALRVQLRGSGISVTTICPGFILTPMTAANEGRMLWVMNPDRAAKLMVRALERKKKVYNFPWQTTFLCKLGAWFPDWLLRRCLPDLSGNWPAPAK